MMVSGPVFPAINHAVYGQQHPKGTMHWDLGTHLHGIRSRWDSCICVYIKYNMDIPNAYSKIQNAPRLKIL